MREREKERASERNNREYIYIGRMSVCAIIENDLNPFSTFLDLLRVVNQVVEDKELAAREELYYNFKSGAKEKYRVHTGQIVLYVSSSKIPIKNCAIMLNTCMHIYSIRKKDGTSAKS